MNFQAKVDLTNCDREPIHLLGAIQPDGFLLALTADWLVARASANTAGFVGVSAEDLIGQPLSEVFTVEAVHTLRNRVAGLRTPDAVERAFGLTLVADRHPFDIALHVSAGQIVIEAQPALQEQTDAPSVVRAMIVRLDQAKNPNAFFAEGVRQVRALTGFDRVMIYRFASDGSGEVVAEACKPGIGSFRGLRYPPSDIPKQARELYRRSLIRVIGDVDATPVPILPIRNEKGEIFDLSLAVLRSVSPIHIEYLRNMGVQASMSISILVDGALWGLIACHHYAPKAPSFEVRSVSELFAQMFSMRLESWERRELVEFERRARDISDQLLGTIATHEALLGDPDWLAQLIAQVIPADGVGIWINGSYAFAGATPPTDAFARITRALNTTAAARVYATDHIASLVPEAESYASIAAGMLVIPISRTPRDYVILFRSELVRSVRWAGDPHKPVEYGPNGPRLTPRESFAEWKELVSGRSAPFTGPEIRVAETLRTTLIEVVLRLASEASAERERVAERQELLIAELNHRVRNILGVIRGLIRQTSPASGSISDFVALVDGRIHALARAHNQITEDHWSPAPLRKLIEAEVAAFLSHGPHRIEIMGEEILLNPQAYSTMALVIHELVTNSTKYGSLSDGGTAAVSWTRDAGGDLHLEWREKDGPPVQPPTRRGFGTTIIERSVPYDLGGRAEIAYAADGVVARFGIPARHVSVGIARRTRPIKPEAIATTQSPTGNSRDLEGEQVLLVEDSLIIALDAEDILGRFGAEVATAATVEVALELIDRRQPTLAMLDINLGSQTSFTIADRLAELGVPFLFATGYGEQAVLPEIHKHRPVVQKPYTLEGLARAFKNMRS